MSTFLYYQPEQIKVMPLSAITLKFKDSHDYHFSLLKDSSTWEINPRYSESKDNKGRNYVIGYNSEITIIPLASDIVGEFINKGNLINALTNTELDSVHLYHEIVEGVSSSNPGYLKIDFSASEIFKTFSIEHSIKYSEYMPNIEIKIKAFVDKNVFTNTITKFFNNIKD